MSELTKTILVVDDEALVRESIADYFEDQGWLVLQAESGEQALEILENESVDAATVDIRMGGMDGNTFIQIATGRWPEMVFAICTGSPEYEIPVDLLKLPCVASQIFRKPAVGMVNLEKEIQMLMGSSQHRGEIHDE